MLPLVRASHPEPTVAVTAIATALAVATGLGGRSLLVAAAFLTGQLSVGWSNDWIDAARDARTGRADKPVARGELPVRAVRAAALTAAALCVPASLALGLPAGLLHLAAVAAAWATAAGALLGVGAHLCNVLPDLEDDLATGIRGLPHALGPLRSATAAAVLLLGATVLLAVGPGAPGPLPVAAVLVAAAVTAAGLVRARRPGSRDAFRAAILVAALSVGLLVARGAVLVPT